MKAYDLARWSFNIPSLIHKLEGVNSGHLIEVGARPNTGKTSFHASLIASPSVALQVKVLDVLFFVMKKRLREWVLDT